MARELPRPVRDASLNERTNDWHLRLLRWGKKKLSGFWQVRVLGRWGWDQKRSGGEEGGEGSAEEAGARKMGEREEP